MVHLKRFHPAKCQTNNVCFCPQKQIGLSQQKVKQRVQEREKELKEVQKAVESLSVSIDLSRLTVLFLLQ